MLRAAERIEDASAVNIGTAEHIKIIDAVHLIFDKMGFTPGSFNFDVTKPVGVFSRAADLTQTRSRLDWEPTTSFAEGLQRTIDWYTQNHDREQVAARLGVLLMER